MKTMCLKFHVTSNKKITNLISSSIHQSSLSLLHSVISSHPSEKLAVKKKKKKKKVKVTEWPPIGKIAAHSANDVFHGICT